MQSVMLLVKRVRARESFDEHKPKSQLREAMTGAGVVIAVAAVGALTGWLLA